MKVKNKELNSKPLSLCIECSGNCQETEIIQTSFENYTTHWLKIMEREYESGRNSDAPLGRYPCSFCDSWQTDFFIEDGITDISLNNLKTKKHLVSSNENKKIQDRIYDEIKDTLEDLDNPWIKKNQLKPNPYFYVITCWNKLKNRGNYYIFKSITKGWEKIDIPDYWKARRLEMEIDVSFCIDGYLVKEIYEINFWDKYDRKE